MWRVEAMRAFAVKSIFYTSILLPMLIHLSASAQPDDAAGAYSRLMVLPELVATTSQPSPVYMIQSTSRSYLVAPIN